MTHVDYSPPTIEALLRHIAPDLTDGAPIYIVAKSWGPPPGIVPDIAYGLTGRSLDLALRTWLEARGDWFGRGVAIVVDDLRLPDNVYAIATICIHEMAHVLADFEIPTGEAPAPIVTAAEIQNVKSSELWDSDLPSQLPPWFGHSGQWLRCCVHLHARAVAAGWPIPLSCVVHAERYGLSHEDVYVDALSSELATSAGKLLDILATRPPQPFIDLWQADVRRWMRAQDICELSPHIVDLISQDIDLFESEERPCPT